MSSVDIVVLDIDGGTMLERCVESIEEQTVRPRRLIVVDNGSRVPVSERLRVVGTTDLQIVRSERNLGFAAGVNAAFAHVDAPYVALVNNDAVLDPEWLGWCRAALERDPKLAAVQTIIRRADGRIDGAGIDIGNGTFRQIGSGLQVGAPLAVAWGVSATAALYRTAAIGRRPFDERLFAYYEDVELCARLREDGWRMTVLPVALATHVGSGSAGALGSDALRLRTRNRYLVARMHPGVGSIGALLWEDVKLLAKGRSSLRAIVEGMRRRVKSEE